MDAAAAAAAAAPPSFPTPKREGPVVCLMIGMAGSGKTTLMQRLNSHLCEHKTGLYCINLDPAVPQCPFAANIDIRDTVKYKEVMSQYNLGPNGAIMTSLNLFATRFDQVLGFLDKRASELSYVLVDTPGQIEAFTWSASGTIITEALSSSFATVVVYVVDVPRSVANPATFMANMLYACSVMYRTRLPLVLALTKTDVMSADTILTWMSDQFEFQKALQSDPSFAHDLTNSMSLVLQEFYRTLRAAPVSALTGEGVEKFFGSVAEAKEEYFDEFLADVERRKKAREEAAKKAEAEQLEKLRHDLASEPKKGPAHARQEEEGEEEEEDAGEDN
eukprot:m51a1_g3242 putative early embryo development protein qqt2 (333) ;mRNA; r:128847-130279